MSADSTWLAFSSPEAALLLVSTSGHVQHRKSAIHGLPVTLRMFRVKFDKSDWFWSQSIVFTNPFKKRNVVGPSQRSRFLVLTKRSAASWDKNAWLDNRDEFEGKDCVFMADWLKTKGLHKLCSVYLKVFKNNLYL